MESLTVLVIIWACVLGQQQGGRADGEDYDELTPGFFNWTVALNRTDLPATTDKSIEYCSGPLLDQRLSVIVS